MKIDIIGAGIGGLTTALCLQQSGHTPTIYESASEIKPVGAGIIMASNAMQIFEKIGVRKEIENVGYGVSSVHITDNELKIISETHLTGFEQKYNVRNIAIHRADLQNILAKKVGFENIELSKHLLRIEKNNKEILLHFIDKDTKCSNVLLAVDGIHSVVRKQLFDETIIRNTQQKCWRGICEFNLPPKYKYKAFELWGKDLALFKLVRIKYTGML